MKNKARVHHIPTNKPEEWWKHLYITTDEEINSKTDWMYHIDAAKTKHIIAPNTWEPNLKFARKIIATTDTKLFVNVKNHLTSSEGLMVNVPQIPQSFIEEYCKAGGIDEVLVEYDDKYSTLPNKFIIIHPVEKKMYSREEVESLCRNAHLLGMKETLPGYPKPETIDKWIEENL